MHLLGWDFVKRMVLKRGDFIEDKFGQMQRRTFIELSNRGSKPDVIQRALDFFGCWLVWMPRRTDGGHTWTIRASYIDEGSESQVPIVAIKGPGNAPESSTVFNSRGIEDRSQDDDRAAASNSFSDSEGSDDDTSCSGQRRASGPPNPNPPARVFVSHLRGRTLGFVNPDHRAHGPSEERQTGKRSDQRREKARLRHSFSADANYSAAEIDDQAVDSSDRIYT